jgi:hypothetical protein
MAPSIRLEFGVVQGILIGRGTEEVDETRVARRTQAVDDEHVVRRRELHEPDAARERIESGRLGVEPDQGLAAKRFEAIAERGRIRYESVGPRGHAADDYNTRGEAGLRCTGARSAFPAQW